MKQFLQNCIFATVLIVYVEAVAILEHVVEANLCKKHMRGSPTAVTKMSNERPVDGRLEEIVRIKSNEIKDVISKKFRVQISGIIIPISYRSQEFENKEGDPNLNDMNAGIHYFVKIQVNAKVGQKVEDQYYHIRIFKSAESFNYARLTGINVKNIRAILKNPRASLEVDFGMFDEYQPDPLRLPHIGSMKSLKLKKEFDSGRK